MMFEEYVSIETAKAMKTEHYEPSGNSTLATFNKSNTSLIKYSALRLCKDLKDVISQPLDEVGALELLSFIVVVPLFPLFVVLRVFHSKKRAKEELMFQWRGSLKRSEKYGVEK